MSGLAALFFVSKPWRNHNWGRVVGALAFLLAWECVGGLIAAALLGAKAGKEDGA